MSKNRGIYPLSRIHIRDVAKMLQKGIKKALRFLTGLCILSERLCVFFFENDSFVYDDSSAVFADNDFLTLTDLRLQLRWNLVVTSRTAIPLDRNNSQTVAECTAKFIVNFR